MTDDKPTLTRRRVLGGMATIGAAGAVGAGAWAQYSDEQSRQYKVEAGTLDLRIQGQEGVATPITVGPLASGDTFIETISYTNDGDREVRGRELGLTLNQVGSSSEGDNPESETNTGGNGELDEQLEVRANKKGQWFFGSSSSYEDYNSVKGTEHVVSLALDGQDSGSINIEGRFKDLANNNEAQGDTVTFDAVLALYQNSAP